MSWMIDPAHTRATFSAKHMMITNVHGQFNEVEGVVDFNEQDPTRSTVDVKIAAASINTREEKRDGHLKSADFFDVEKYPHLLFKSTRAEKTSENTGRLYGNLTIRDVTKPVTLEVEYNGQAKSPWGTVNAGFSATTKVNRKDWGLNWNMALETGGFLVGDIITINLEVEIVKQTAPEAQAVAA